MIDPVELFGGWTVEVDSFRSVVAKRAGDILATLERDPSPHDGGDDEPPSLFVHEATLDRERRIGGPPGSWVGPAARDVAPASCRVPLAVLQVMLDVYEAHDLDTETAP